MTRIYIMPKVLILMIFLILVFQVYAWYDILIFLSGAIVAVMVFIILYIFFLGKYYMHLKNIGKKLSREKLYKYVNQVAATVNRFMLMDITWEHDEVIDKNKHYLVIPNHQSNADTTVLLEVFKTPVSFVAKNSLTKVPLVRDWMKLIDCVFLNKGDMRSQIAVMNEVADMLQEKKTFVIFAGGSRSFSKQMLEFKPGTFKMATKTQVDILPVTLNNVYQLRQHLPFRKTYVHVYFHKPISYEEYKDMGTQEIASMVQKIVESKIE